MLLIVINVDFYDTEQLLIRYSLCIRF